MPAAPKPLKSSRQAARRSTWLCALARGYFPIRHHELAAPQSLEIARGLSEWDGCWLLFIRFDSPDQLNPRAIPA